MSVARNNFLKSTIAIAISSFIFSPLEAGTTKTVKLSGTDIDDGSKVVRKLIMSPSDDPDAPTQLEFEGELNSRYFFSSIKKHGFHLVEVTTVEGNQALGYTTIVMLGKTEVVAVDYDLKFGRMKQLINTNLKRQLTTVLRGKFAPIEAPGELYTSLSDPAECDHLFAAIKETINAIKLSAEPDQLEETASWEAPSLKTKASFISRPGALANNKIGIQTNPEVALAIMTKSLIEEALSEADESADSVTPAPYIKTISDSVKTSMPPIMVAVYEDSDPELTKDLGSIPTVIMSIDSPDDIVLNVDLVNPVATVWAKDLIRGAHNTGDLKILYRTTDDIIDACQIEQSKIIKSIAENPDGMTDGMVQDLIHSQQQRIMLTFAKSQGKDVTLTAAQRNELHRQMGTNLHLQLMNNHKHNPIVKNTLEHPAVIDKLGRASHACCDLPLSEDQITVQLLLHNNEQVAAAIKTALREAASLQEIERQTLITALDQAKMENENLQKLIANDEVLVKYAPSTLKSQYLGECTDDEATYNQIQTASTRHPGTSPEQIKKKWQVMKEFEHLIQDRDKPEALVRSTARSYLKLTTLLNDDGNIKPEKEAAFKAALSEAGLNPETDQGAVKKLFVTLNGEEVESYYDDVRKRLDTVDLDELTSGSIATTKTGITFQLAKRFKQIAETNPESIDGSLNEKQAISWIAQLSKSSDIPSTDALEVAIQSPELIQDFHPHLVEIASSELSKRVKRPRYIKQLIAYAELNKQLEAVGQQDDMSAIIEHYDELSSLLYPYSKEQEPLAEGECPAFVGAVRDKLKMEGQASVIRKAIITIEKEEFPLLSPLAQHIKALHEQLVLHSEAIELGQHSPAELDKLVSVYKQIPLFVQAKQDSLQSQDDTFQQSFIDYNNQLKLLAESKQLPPEQELSGFPEDGDLLNDNQIFNIEQIKLKFGRISSSQNFAFLMKQVKHLITELAEEAREANELFDWLANQRVVLYEYIGTTPGEVNPAFKQAFSELMTTYKLNSNNPANVKALASIIYYLDKEEIESLLEYYEVLNTEIGIDENFPKKMRQVEWNMDDETVKAARNVLHHSPDTYQSLSEDKQRVIDTFKMYESKHQTLSGKSDLAPKIKDLKEKTQLQKEENTKLQQEVQQLIQKKEEALALEKKIRAIIAPSTDETTDSQDPASLDVLVQTLKTEKDQLEQKIADSPDPEATPDASVQKELQAKQTQLDEVEQEFEKYETAHRIERKGNSLQQRATQIITNTENAESRFVEVAQELKDAEFKYSQLQKLHSMPTLISPLDFPKTLPENDLYNTLVLIANPFDSVPHTTMIHQLSTIESFVTQLRVQTGKGWEQEVKHLKSIISHLPSILGTGTGDITDSTDITLQLTKAGIDKTIATDVARVLQVTGLQGWQDCIDNIVNFHTIPTRFRLSRVPDTIWSLVRSGLSYDELKTVQELSQTIPEYEAIYSHQWLSKVKHPLPTPDQLVDLPHPELSESDFALLVQVVSRHPGVSAEVLVDKLKKMYSYLSNSFKVEDVAVEDLTLTEDNFHRLKQKLASTAEGDSMDVFNSKGLSEGDQYQRLNAIVAQCDTPSEFNTLLIDADELATLMSAHGIDADLAKLARSGFTPRVMHLAKVAHDQHQALYNSRREAISAEDFNYWSEKIIASPKWLPMLTSTESADLAGELPNTNSDVYKMVQDIVTSIPKEPDASAVTIHTDLVEAYQIIENIPEDRTAAFVEHFKRIYTFGKIYLQSDNHQALNKLISTNKLDQDKQVFFQIIKHSHITPDNIDQYIQASQQQRNILKGVVPLPILAAVYEGHTPESFGQMHTWVTKNPQLRKQLAEKAFLRQIVADSRPFTKHHQRQQELLEIEQLKRSLIHHQEKLEGLSPDTMQRHEELEDLFPELKKPFTEAHFVKVHPNAEAEDSSTQILKRVHNANSLNTLDETTGQFLDHPEVAAAENVPPALKKLKNAFREFPSEEALQGFEQLSKAIKDKAGEWTSAFEEHTKQDSTPSNHVKELMTRLTPERDQPLTWPTLYRTKVELFPSERDTVTTASSVIERIRKAHPHIQTLQQMHLKSQGEELEIMDINKVHEAANALLEEEGSLPKAWLLLDRRGVGEGYNKKIKPLLDTLAVIPNQHQAKDELVKFFDNKSITEGLLENQHIVKLVEHLEDVPEEYISSERLMENLKEALTDTHSTIRQHKESAPMLASKISTNTIPVEDVEVAGAEQQPPAGEVNGDADQPQEVVENANIYVQAEARQKLRQQAEALLSPEVQQEREALEETHNIAQKLAELRMGSLKKEREKGGDLDSITAAKHRTIIKEADKFCQDCQKSSLVTKIGTEHFKDLHKKGVPDEDKIASTMRALDKEKAELISQVAASEEVIEDFDRVAQTLPSLRKIKEVLDQMATQEPESVATIEQLRTGKPELYKEILMLTHSGKPDLTKDIETLEQKCIQQELQPDQIEEVKKYVAGRHPLPSYSAGADNDIEVAMDQLAEEDLSAWKTLKRGQQGDASLTAVEHMTETLDIMHKLPSPTMQQAALLLNQVLIEKEVDLTNFPRGSFDQIKSKLRSVYTTSELPDDMLQNYATHIHKATLESDDAWELMTGVAYEIPLKGADMLQGAVKVLKAVSYEKSQQFLTKNDVFIRWMKRDSMVRNLNGLVKRYQLSVEDIMELRNPKIHSPKAAKMIAMSSEDLNNLRDTNLMPDEVWEKGILAIVKDPEGYAHLYPLMQTGSNLGWAGLYFLWEFIIDDLTFNGGYNTIAIILGHGDKILAERNIPKEQVVRAAIIYLERYITSPDGQKAIATVGSPIFGGYQVYRTSKDIYNLIRTGDMSERLTRGMSVSIMLLAWINELAWGGELTHRMVQVSRGLDSVADVQKEIEAYMVWAQTQFMYEKISEAEMDTILNKSLSVLELIDDSNPDWEAHIDDAIELLRGYTSQDRLNKMQMDVHSHLNYRHIAKAWHNGVDDAVTTLRPWRPVTSIVGGAFPKAQLVRGLFYPALNGIINGWPGRTFPRLVMPAKWLSGGVISSTLTYFAGSELYDMTYNDFETTRQMLEPAARALDEFWGVDFEKAEKTGIAPLSMSRIINETLPALSLSSPNSYWINSTNFIMGLSTRFIDNLYDKNPESEGSLTHWTNKTITHSLFGHKNSAVGYVLKAIAAPVYNAAVTTISASLDAVFNRPPQALFELGYSHTAGTTITHNMTREEEYKWIGTGAHYKYPAQLKLDSTLHFKTDED